jgi:phosphoribosylaminoimidazole-succinocarboxamide synthase
MAEVQTSTNSGELAQRFIEFVMMQAQNAALFLGQIPNPQTGKGEVNLEVAKMFIDQLAMIQEKTRGNLSNEESTVLRNALSNLQLAYVEVARGSSATAGPSEKKTPESAPPDASVAPEPPTAGPEGESRKKFTKSYGA